LGNSRNKKATAFALLLVFTAVSTGIILPYANAQSTGTCTTYAFVGATPNPIGVGQETLLWVGISAQLSTASLGWVGLSLTIEKPDGTTETISDIRTDSTGGTGRVYKPTMAGTYYIQTHFPEQRMPTSAGGIPANTTMKASVSEKLALIVQEEPIAYYPGVPLPTEFWTRPINAQFREWSTIAGSSWESSEYNDAPDSPHILWAKPLTIGGLVGGSKGEVGSGATSVAFENGDAYEGKWSTRMILAGRLYYIDGSYDRPRYTHCVDLRTGEELWSKVFMNNASISFGQLMYWESYNYQGTFAYLWFTSTAGSGSSSVTTWSGYDAFTGEWMCNITNVPSGTRVEGKRGEEFIYNVDLNRGYMTLWNQSNLVSIGGSWGSALQTRTLNASLAYANGTLQTAQRRAWAWNITIPKGLPGSVRGVKLDDMVFGASTTTDALYLWAFSLKKGQEGQLLYNKTWQTPAEWKTGNVTFATYGSSWSQTDMDAKVGLAWAKELRKYYAFNLDTGEFMWEQEVKQPYLDIYSIGARIYQGKMYTVGMAGQVHCFNVTTGKLMWIYNATDPYTEMLWGNNWPLDLLFTNDGKLYFFHSEHSANQPLPRGAPAVCLDATTGEELWRVDGLFRKTDWGGGPIMGDSVIAMYNTYDQRVYAIGKGPSATTVTVGPKSSVFGSSVVIEGTVTDVSPGTKQTEVALRFANGVAAVSDESVGEWMKYVYVQFPRPMDTVGVEVTLSVLDSNGNYREIGKTTSDSNGFFSYQWTPDITGKYTVYASFTGSKSYYPSNAETAFAVDAAPEPVNANTDTTNTQVMPPFELYFAGATAAIIIAVALATVLILRKRP